MNRFVSIVLLAALLLQLAPPIYAQTAGEEKSIAIIDFKNTSGKSDLDYLEQAIPEAVMTRLAESGKLNIVERARLKDAIKEMQLGVSGVVDQSEAVKIGRAVGATAILVGSFLEIGGVIQLNARLIQVETSQVLIAKVVKGKVGTEIFNLMDELAAAIEEKLLGEGEAAEPEPEPEVISAEPTPEQPEQVTPPPTKKKGGSNTALWILGGAALIGGGVAAAMLLGGDDGDGNGGNTNSNVSVVVTVP